MKRLICVLSLMLLCPAFAGQEHTGARSGERAGEPFIRIKDDDDSGRVSLQIASRTYRRGPEEPAVTLVGAAHIGTPAYYHALQRLLDANDLVLFEGVGPIWATLAPDADDRERARATRERLRTLGLAIEARRRRGETPDTLAALLTDRGYRTRLLRTATRDGWGHPIRYTHDADGFDLTSLGADAAPGGRGADADLSLSDLPPLQDAELDDAKGIQSSLADAAGLVFQLDAIEYDKPNWRNCDTTAEALSYAMAGLNPDDARPGDGSPRTGGGSPLFDLMRGEGLVGRLAGGMLKLLGSSPRSSAMLRLMLIETLAHADDLMGMDVEGLNEMMDVLLEQRNGVVLRDLRKEIDRRTDRPGRIAVFYGAGHLAGLAADLEKMGYRPTTTTWLDAVRVDPGAVGMTPQQARGVRSMIDSMLATQMRDHADHNAQKLKPAQKE